MSRAFLLIAVAVAALVAVPAGSALTQPETIRLLETTGTETEINVGSEEFGPGDGFTLSDPLYRWAGSKRGARVGRLEAHCTFTWVQAGPPETAGAYCVGTIFLPAGQIVGAKHLRFTESGPPSFQLAVLGGTGRYSNARGIVVIRDIGAEGNSAVILRLTP
jgi:hypothetical protein